MPGPPTRPSNSISTVDRLFGSSNGTGRGTVAGLTEEQLLDRVVASNDDAAFEALVRLHGKAVMSVCRRLLADPAAADDAFQATFIVLSRKAGSLRRSKPLAPWLVGVAYRIASKSRVAAARRQAHESAAASRRPEAVAPLDPVTFDLAPILWEELQRLPGKYRDPIVLCWVQGLSLADAAERLRWPVGTVKGRLHRARETLRSRLSRRGITAPAAGLASWFSAESAQAITAPPLITATVKLAIATATASTASLIAGTVPAGSLILAHGALRAMQLKALTTATTALVLVGGSLAGGVGVASSYGLISGPGTLTAAVASVEAPAFVAPGQFASPPNQDDGAPAASTAATFNPPELTPPSPEDGSTSAPYDNFRPSTDVRNPRPIEFSAIEMRAAESDFRNGAILANDYLVMLKLHLAHQFDSASSDDDRIKAVAQYLAQLDLVSGLLEAKQADSLTKQLVAAERSMAEATLAVANQFHEWYGGMMAGPPQSMFGRQVEAQTGENDQNPPQAPTTTQTGMPGMMQAMGYGGGGGGFGGMMAGGGGGAIVTSPITSNPSPSTNRAGGGMEFGGVGGDDGPGDDPASFSIKNSLDQPISMQFQHGTTMGELIQFLRDSTKNEEFPQGIPIFIDDLGLQEAELTLEAPVQLDLQSVPARTSLWLALWQLDLVYSVKEGVLIISTPARMDILLNQEPIYRSQERGMGGMGMGMMEN